MASPPTSSTGTHGTAAIRARLMAHANPDHVPILRRFFKTGPGEYGEGDVFVGVRVPALRSVCRECRGASLDVILSLLRSRVHEERAIALMLLVDAFARADLSGRREIYTRYLEHTEFINNWDLVDSSAAQIVGAWLQDRSRAPLTKLAASTVLWERRIAMIATYHYIKQGQLDETFRIAGLLLDDPHDLIHKAVGWMLREAGNRDGAAERRFLNGCYQRMPRTMLRYAIEKFPEAERQRYLKRAS